jgi:hypothetical protein
MGQFPDNLDEHVVGLKFARRHSFNLVTSLSRPANLHQMVSVRVRSSTVPGSHHQKRSKPPYAIFNRGRPDDRTSSRVAIGTSSRENRL